MYTYVHLQGISFLNVLFFVSVQTRPSAARHNTDKKITKYVILTLLYTKYNFISGALHT